MSRNGKREGKTTAKQRLSTRQLMNTRRITEYSLETYDGDELVYFMIRPTNLSVLSESSVGARVYALMNVLKGVAEIEMLCLNSRENFEENKGFLRRRADEEDIKRILAVYYEQNVTSEKFEDFDGARWIIPDD